MLAWESSPVRDPNASIYSDTMGGCRRGITIERTYLPSVTGYWDSQDGLMALMPRVVHARLRFLSSEVVYLLDDALLIAAEISETL
mmetsp:Transcript_19825/g.19055  ORF Transcript_19825/g.19055 Transcript_19825/m.19055 type:complete len:86 (-) Transcript_19825:845-1102(-)